MYSSLYKSVMGAFDVHGYPPARPEQIQIALAGFNNTYTEATNDAAAFAGFTITNNHLSTTITSDTQSVVVSPGPEQRVVLKGVTAYCSTNNVLAPFIGTFAQEGSDDDLVIYQATGYGNFLAHDLNIALDKGKDLIHYRVQGDTTAGRINSVTVTYQIVPA